MKIKSQKGISLLILVLIIAILIIVVGGATYFIIKNKDSKDLENSTNDQTTNNEKNTSTNNNNKLSDKELNSWNGTYKSGNITIQMYRTYENNDNNFINFNYWSEETMEAGSYNFKLNSANELIYKHSSLDETSDDIIIKKTNDGISVEIFPSNSESELSIIVGTYKKEDINDFGWDGLYTNDLASISLAQYSNEELYVNITKNIKNGYVGRADIINNSLNSKELNYNDSFFDKSCSMKIIKTDLGIKIESSSTDTTDILNEINGLEFTKVI